MMYIFFYTIVFFVVTLAAGAEGTNNYLDQSPLTPEPFKERKETKGQLWPNYYLGHLMRSLIEEPLDQSDSAHHPQSVKSQAVKYDEPNFIRTKRQTPGGHRPPAGGQRRYQPYGTGRPPQPRQFAQQTRLPQGSQQYARVPVQAMGQPKPQVISQYPPMQNQQRYLVMQQYPQNQNRPPHNQHNMAQYSQFQNPQIYPPQPYQQNPQYHQPPLPQHQQNFGVPGLSLLNPHQGSQYPLQPNNQVRQPILQLAQPVPVPVTSSVVDLSRFNKRHTSQHDLNTENGRRDALRDIRQYAGQTNWQSDKNSKLTVLGNDPTRTTQLTADIQRIGQNPQNYQRKPNYPNGYNPQIQPHYTLTDAKTGFPVKINLGPMDKAAGDTQFVRIGHSFNQPPGQGGGQAVFQAYQPSQPQTSNSMHLTLFQRPGGADGSTDPFHPHLHSAVAQNELTPIGNPIVLSPRHP